MDAFIELLAKASRGLLRRGDVAACDGSGYRRLSRKAGVRMRQHRVTDGDDLRSGESHKAAVRVFPTDAIFRVCIGFDPGAHDHRL